MNHRSACLGTHALTTLTPQREGRRGASRLLMVLLATLLTFSSPVTQAFAADGATYRFGTLEEYSTYALGELLNDSFAWSDDWFFDNPEDRNDALALASMQLTAAAVYDGADSKGGAFLSDLGFDQVGYERFGSSDPDDCTFTWGTKTIGEGSDACTLVAVAIQSYSFDNQIKAKGWKQNFRVNDEAQGITAGEHVAFARAVGTVLDDIATLAGGGKVKYWVCGQSRGGALANLIAAKLPSVLGSSNEGIYAYTFEAPSTVDTSAIADAGAYAYIHNYRCSDDIVTHVPMWGMTVYGNTYELKTDKTDAGLISELTKLGSKAAEEDIPEVAEYEMDVISALEEQIPTRSDYSRVRTDTFADASGKEVSVTYSYQDTLLSLMAMMFDGELEGFSADAVLDNTSEFAPSLVALGEAMAKAKSGEISESDVLPHYWEAAKVLRGFMARQAPAGDVSMSNTDFYALLRLIAPFSFDTSYESTGDTGTDMMGYISPLVTTAVVAPSFVYSHHFDMLIARLKSLAPQVPMDDVDIVIDEPAAGDAVSKAPGEVTDFVASLGDSWLTAEASWQSTSDSLEDDMVYYLDITLRAVGHVAPEDLKITVNGATPEGDLEVSYADGACVVSGTWEFVIGNPKDVTVSFDAAGHGEAPEALRVKKGTLLKYVAAPEPAKTVTEDGITYRFGGWESDDGTAWDQVFATQDLTVHARWIRIVDDISITFAVPKLGDAMPEPAVPEGAPYYLSEYSYNDSDWNTAEVADAPGSYMLWCCVSLVDASNSEFALERQDDGGVWYTGSAAVNGDSVEGTYDDTGLYVRVEYGFEVTEREPEAPTYEFASGAEQTWTKGSDTAAEFVVKRSPADEETFVHFTGVELDEEVVAPESYTAKEGSVILSLTPTYLEALSVGEHSLAVQFDDGAAKTTLVVQEAKTEPEPEQEAKPEGTKPEQKANKPTQRLPQTGDGTSAPWQAALLSLGLAMMCGGICMRGKTRMQ